MAFPEKQKSTYCGEWKPVEYPNKLPLCPFCYGIIQEGIFTRNQSSNSFERRFGQYYREKLLKSKIEITTNLDKILYFPIPRVDMEKPPPDNAYLDPSVTIDVRVEEDEAIADHINSTEG